MSAIPDGMTAELWFHCRRSLWSKPERWRPGMPIYESATYESWQTGPVLQLDRNDGHECETAHCNGDHRRWVWVADPHHCVREWMRVYFGAEPTDGEFYGATVRTRTAA